MRRPTRRIIVVAAILAGWVALALVVPTPSSGVGTGQLATRTKHLG